MTWLGKNKISPNNQTKIGLVIRRALKVEAGDYLEWFLENGEVKVRKASE